MVTATVWQLVGLIIGACADEAAFADRMALWQRGVHEVAPHAAAAYARYARALPVLRHRGGGASCGEAGCDVAPVDYGALEAKLGPDFAAMLRLNEADHAADCATSCEKFYCAPADAPPAPSTIATRAISMGSVPPEDFASEFAFPLDLIRVSTAPVVSPAAAAEAVAIARSENVDENEYTSGKYRLGGDWLTKMDATRAWFNAALEAAIFPAIAASFPEVVTNASTLRAHSVAMLKYNATHPRTDVHIDNGILALTLALSPKTDYVGGGTFFEHLGEDKLVEMDAGHATWRPGSVRHGGHRVSRGTRYIIGAFLLLSDRVEHVRRTKNRGAALRGRGDLAGAVRHFEWALAINPRCATCMKDLAEAESTRADGDPGRRDARLAAAEAALRSALDLLPSDSDALFSLGVVLSKRGDAAGALAAYEASADVNADDVELLYNLAVKLGEAGRRAEEAAMYERALTADPDFSKARCNLGAAVAERGDLDGAEAHFRRAAASDPASPTPWQNLAILYHKRGIAQVGGLQTARSKDAAVAVATTADASLAKADAAWRHVLERVACPDARAETTAQLAQLLSLRGRATAIVDPADALPHFVEASKLAPTAPGAWEALAKCHQLLGNAAEAAKAAARLDVLKALAAPKGA